MQLNIYLLHPFLFTLIVIAVCLLVFVGGSAITRKNLSFLFITAEDMPQANIIMRQSSTLLSVFLAFIVISIWGDYETQRKNTAQEAVIIANIYRDTRGFEPDKEQKIKDLTVDYTTLLINDAWPKMRVGKESRPTWLAFNELYGYVIRLAPNGAREEIILKQTVDNLHELARFRRLRLLRNGNPVMPDLLWGIIFSITALVLFSNFLLRMNNQRMQLILTTISASILGMIFSLLLLLNHPYSGGLQISPYPLENLLKDVFPTSDVTQLLPTSPANSL